MLRFRHSQPSVTQALMFKWTTKLEWGRRASDQPVPTPAIRASDHLLEGAIAHERIEVLFQPLIDPRTGEIVGAEALARSDLAESAHALFERAAAAGLAERLSRLVQRKALRCAGAWEKPLKNLILSINILPEDISREGFDDWLLAEISTAGVDPSKVTAEITESALIVDEHVVAERLTRLREAGITIAVDDFGTGYANLAYLTSLPVDMLKIDRALVADIVGGVRDRIVVKAMIRLARDLDLKVAVEGVESTDQLALLAEWGCDLYQGFLGAGALTQEELWRFVSAAQVEAA
jgi:EAL domain-containing protein (putative c-di-GMP-specific phosphodiesterase class I)